MLIKKNYHLLHGFLGDCSYFSKLVDELKSKSTTENVYAYSLLSPNTASEVSSQHDFLSWAHNFNEKVRSVAKLGVKNSLIAYSMGGRLGIHAYQLDNTLWSECHFISSNPGLIKSSQRMVRMAWEDGWCYQIDHKNWQEFIQLWNAQDIFKHSIESVPEEEKFCKVALKNALKNWSLTKHKIDLEQIKDNRLNWYVGENDTKYNLIHKQMREQYGVESITVLKGQGHRVSHLGFDDLNLNEH